MASRLAEVAKRELGSPCEGYTHGQWQTCAAKGQVNHFLLWTGEVLTEVRGSEKDRLFSGTRMDWDVSNGEPLASESSSLRVDLKIYNLL